MIHVQLYMRTEFDTLVKYVLIDVYHKFIEYGIEIFLTKRHSGLNAKITIKYLKLLRTLSFVKIKSQPLLSLSYERVSTHGNIKPYSTIELT